MRILVLLALCALCASMPLVTTNERSNKCKMTPKYPPPKNHTAPTYVINLDLPAQERWKEVATEKAQDIKAMLDNVLQTFPPKIVKALLKRLDNRSEEMLNAFPAPYGDEIRGIAAATKIEIGLVILYNIFYEVSGFCTSIVAESSDGEMFHGRNLDFALFLGWNFTEGTWSLPEKLRPLIFNADFQRDGMTVYKGVHFAGYVGLLTGVKKGAFSISVDSRFDLQFDRGVLQWIHGDHSGNWLTFQTRSVMENNATYDEAVSVLSTCKMVGPSYIIVGGLEAGKGAVITRTEEKALDVWTIESRKKENKYYLVETNYDHWERAPFFDDRRDPANACMDILGRNGTSFAGLYNVLSAQPNLNQMTTYTALMNVRSGDVETYLQWCPHPCTIW